MQRNWIKKKLKLISYEKNNYYPNVTTDNNTL